LCLSLKEFITYILIFLLAIVASKYPHNVCFQFPRVGARELWANAKILSDSSPYFKTLFSSGFAESHLSTPSGEKQLERKESKAEAESKVEAEFKIQLQRKDEQKTSSILTSTMTRTTRRTR
jgi:hypothetical protein